MSMDQRRRLQLQGQELSSSSSHEISVPTNNQRNLSAVFATRQEYGTGVILLNLIVVVYYAIIMEAITTVAHICALILGALLHIWFAGGLENAPDEAAAIPLLQESSSDAVPDAPEISGSM